MGLLDFAQAASNTAADTVSGPVELMALALRKLGVPVPQDPIAGAAWMQKHGFTKPVKQSASSLAGETLGLLAPLGAVAKAPQIAKGLLQAGDNLAVPRRLNPQTGAFAWHGPNKKGDMTAPDLADLISSQRYLDRDLVAQKIKDGDFVVKVTPPFSIEGERVRAITDGHHALQAAIRSGNDPQFVQQTVTSNDRVELLNSGKIEDYLEAAYHDAPWYRYATGNDLW